MQNILEAKSVVLVSTTELHEQLARLEDSLPQVRELVESTCPNDPAYDDRADMLLSTVTAIVWLREALR